MSTLTVPLNGSLIALPTLLLRPTPTGACARPYPASLPRDRHAWRTFVLEAGSSQELPEIRHSVLPVSVRRPSPAPGTDAADRRTSARRGEVGVSASMATDPVASSGTSSSPAAVRQHQGLGSIRLSAAPSRSPRHCRG